MPGIHSNTVASILSTFGMPPDAFACLVVALLGAHIVFQFFPSIFLAIPDDTVVSSTLPGHRMALSGRGREAILVCVISIMIACAASALLLPVALALLPVAYSVIEPHLALVLLGASAALLLSEKKPERVAIAAGVFLLSGILGVVTLSAPINDPLFPAFSGLFAASGILLSFQSHRRLPQQKEEKTKLDFLPFVAIGVLLGILSDLLPGIAAPAQIAIFASVFVSFEAPRKFLALVSSIAASHSVFAFGALLSIGKAREGAIAILNEISPVMPSDLPSLVGVFLLSVGVSSALLLLLSRHANFVASIDSKALNLGILAYLVCAVAIISGWMGLLLLATSTCIGVMAPLLGVRRNHVMGLIIVPSIMLAA